MTEADHAALVEQLIRHESERLTPYFDTVGKATIGVGRNLTDRGITREESRRLLDADVATGIAELTAAFGWFSDLDVVRQRALLDMHLNLGITRLRGFTLMLSAIGRKNYEVASSEMMRSLWARQVGARAITLAEMMASGEAPVFLHPQSTGRI